MLITIKSKRLLDFFGWDMYDNKPREIYPSYVTTSFKLWWQWRRDKWERSSAGRAFGRHPKAHRFDTGRSHHL